MEAKALELPSHGTVRAPVDADAIRRLMTALGRELRQETSVYLVGGTSAVVSGWRATTIDIDLKAIPDSELFAVIQRLKESLGLNIETASPHDFLPPLPRWRERSPFIAREGMVSYFHFDFYSQALAKIERGFQRDLADVNEMVQRGLVVPARAIELLDAIVPELVRFPAVDATSFCREVRRLLAAED